MKLPTTSRAGNGSVAFNLSVEAGQAFRWLANHRPTQRCCRVAFGKVYKPERGSCAKICPICNSTRVAAMIGLVADLLAQGAEVFRIRLEMPSSTVAANKLSDLKIGSIKAQNRRLFRTITHPALKAVGRIKVVQSSDGDAWFAQSDQLVVGATLADLQAAFVNKRYAARIELVAAEELEDVIVAVLSREITGWEKPWHRKSHAPSRKNQSRYYRWQMTLSPDEAFIRYGLDRHLQPLDTSARKPMKRKKRPYPWHLQAYMFGHPNRLDPHTMEAEIKRMQNR